MSASLPWPGLSPKGPLTPVCVQMGGREEGDGALEGQHPRTVRRCSKKTVPGTWVCMWGVYRRGLWDLLLPNTTHIYVAGAPRISGQDVHAEGMETGYPASLEAREVEAWPAGVGVTASFL